MNAAATNFLNRRGIGVSAFATAGSGHAFPATAVTASCGCHRQPAAYRDCRIDASEQEVAQALEGNWQQDQLFLLRQEQAGYEFCQQQVRDCDQQLAQYLAQLEDRTQGATASRDYLLKPH